MNISKLKQISPNDYWKYFHLDVPIDVYKLAKELGITIVEDFDFDKLDYSGEIKIQDGKPIIWVNPLEADVRKRFTIAHEIGHYILHISEGKASSFIDDYECLRRSNLWDIQEYQANNFAARLLMPVEKIKEVGINILNQNREISEENFINEMANRFNVSPIAMKYRLINLGILQKK